MFLHGNIFDYFIVFGAGVLVSFTPCVYPLLPVTASTIAGLNIRGDRWTGFWLSVIYVLGIAVSYSSLAVIAALQGQVFGRFQQNPFTFLAMAAVLFAFALVILEVIPFPILGAGLQNKIRPRSVWTLFLFGIVSGFVVGPCTGSVLGPLLLYVSSKQNLFNAVTLLFVFSYGLGASLILVGTFSGFWSVLPKSGFWLVRVKQFCALVLCALAAVFIYQGISLL